MTSLHCITGGSGALCPELAGRIPFGWGDTSCGRFLAYQGRFGALFRWGIRPSRETSGALRISQFNRRRAMRAGNCPFGWDLENQGKSLMNTLIICLG